MYGNAARHENAEKKNTIKGPFSPLIPRYRTQVYAPPAHTPPMKPQSAGNVADRSKDGLMINKLPIKAITMAIHWKGDNFSFRKM